MTQYPCFLLVDNNCILRIAGVNPGETTVDIPAE
jgi:hypothetical protein